MSRTTGKAFCAAIFLAVAHSAMAGGYPDIEMWKEIVNFRPSLEQQAFLLAKNKSRSPFEKLFLSRWAYQAIELGRGNASLDYYSIKITQFPKPNTQTLTPEQFLSHVRLNINDFVDPLLCEFKPYSEQDGLKWKSSDPLGAVIGIDFSASFRWLSQLDDGSVVVSAFAPDYWIFSTVTTPDDRFHPVSGIRKFGIYREGDVWYFFTTGADRAAQKLDNRIASVVFACQGEVWDSLQENLLIWINKHGGVASEGRTTRRRIDWLLVESTIFLKDNENPVPWIPGATR